MAANPQPAPQGASFKLVLVCAVVITITSLGVALYLSKQPQTDAIKSPSDRVQTVYVLGCGAILGLFSLFGGGKALR